MGSHGLGSCPRLTQGEKTPTDQVINFVGVSYEREAYPHNTLPAVTFEDAMQFHIIGEQSDNLHF